MDIGLSRHDRRYLFYQAERPGMIIESAIESTLQVR